MENKIIYLSAFLVVAVAVALVINASESPEIKTFLSNLSENIKNPQSPNPPELKRFNSYYELQTFLKEKTQNNYRYLEKSIAVPMAVQSNVQISESAAGSTDYSRTNIQVEGVDEADIVKSDGKYIYMISGGQLVIVDAYPPKNAGIISQIALEGTPREIFINKDKLAVFGQAYGETVDTGRISPSGWEPIKPIIRGYSYAYVKVYDITDRANPKLKRDVKLNNGNYYSSRMIGKYIYAVINMPVYYSEPGPIPLPTIMENKKAKDIQAEEIYYFDYPDYSYNYINIISVNMQDDDEEYNSKTYLSGNTQNIYVSTDNIYLTHATWNAPETANDETKPYYANREYTAIYKIAIKDGKTEYKAKGTVPGNTLNQFSMDEHDGYFRIATTKGHVQRFAEADMATNNIYILDKDMKPAGEIEGLAPGERIYSARFMGERAYMVTFKKVDPLFVIDLKNPYKPKLLGKLKIPGYSDYLHPYDENHIIGIGKEAVEAEEGDFAWYQGIKIALFDVSDPENPKEISKYNIGDRGTDSYALHDHKAFLFDREKGLLAIPVQLAEIDKSRYAGGKVPANAYGDYTWQGAYVFNVDLENGFQLKGRITHVDDDSLEKSGYYYYSDKSIKRTLYIGDILYTVSDSMLKLNYLKNLEEIKTIKV